jgi:hypothetical protein
MASSIDVSCPQCQKKIKASAELQGKKVRCKGCGHIFAIPGSVAAAPKDAKPAAVKVAPAPAAEDDGPKAYAVSAVADDSLPRCPHCANEMASADAVVCIHCGYNTKSRQRMGTQRTYETTSSDRMSWLMPGFLSLGGIFALIVFDLILCLALPRMVDEQSDWSLLTARPVRLWSVIISIIVILGLDKFAFQRLIVNPNPPEKLKSS